MPKAKQTKRINPVLSAAGKKGYMAKKIKRLMRASQA